MPIEPIRRLALAALIALVGPALGACTGSSFPLPDVDRTGPPPVVLAPGEVSDDDEERAARLLATARSALEAGRLEEARNAARTVVDEIPGARVSGEALLVLGRASAQAGAWEEARAAAARLGRLLPAGDPRAMDAALVEARALRGLERPAEAVERLLAAPAATPPPDDALALVRESVAAMDRATLGELLEGAPLGQPLAAPVMAAYSRTLLLAGDGEGARRFARAAIEAGAAGEDAAVAEAVLEGGVPGGAARARLGALLPLTGSPALRTFAEGVREGVEAAVAASGLGEVVELEVLDTGGDVTTTGSLVRSAESQGAVALVGPLQTDATAAAARARGSAVPIISPTAYGLPDGMGSVYSLASVDPGAPRALAEWAADVGIRQVVVLHAMAGPSSEEARIFAEAYQARGGSVLRSLTYESGATYFGEQIGVVRDLRPEAVVLPVPPEDLSALAPQLRFFGLDTLGIQVLGTGGWTDSEVLQEVDNRHLEGVVAASPRRPGADNEGFRRFVEAYEERFQRTLVEPAVPALGYDAASLLLLAIRSGARTPEAVARALEDVRGFQGATGVLSVEEGRVLREQELVCVHDGQLLAMEAGTRPQPIYRPHMPDPETGIVPEGPGRLVGLRCPGVVVEEQRGGTR